ncbi:MAG: bifunctional glycosyltransferase family 2 protein/CDP-glycerol:glycerophosphate glycerophosphotransferase [Coriobacteriales bacterium]|jgi:CDP-glycerol glycerophosphotransferase (TagB/SpsB family)/glycosyltransferase involved in cell wall biosynthesis|nr:bifunctional glycosyltransferase family 2 protein/CDP-glycerol:glycerophosphate glycerophosphotransferase [Coriobacteriales bacterium]
MEEYYFSVITPLYNEELFVREAIESVIAQTVGFAEHVQLILVDDGSTDGSLGIIEQYRRRFPDNIVLLKQDHRGVSTARNAALDRAEGEIVCFLDADDKYDPKIMEKVWEFHQGHPEINFIRGQVMLFGAVYSLHPVRMGGPRSGHILSAEDVATEKIESGTIHACFFVKAAIGPLRFDPTLSMSEDALYMVTFLVQEGRFAVLPDAVSYYRKHYNADASAISTSNRNPRRMFPAWDRLIEDKTSIFFDQEGKLKLACQAFMLYELHWFARKKADLEGLGDAAGRRRYCQELAPYLSYIDDQLIAHYSRLSRYQRAELLSIKYGEGIRPITEIYHAEPSSNQKSLVARNPWGCLGQRLKKIKPTLTNFSVRDQGVTIAGFLHSCFDLREAQVLVRNEAGDEIAATPLDPKLRLTYAFGIVVEVPHGFRLELPAAWVESSHEIKLVIRLRGYEANLVYNFPRICDSFMNKVPGMYGIVGKHLVTCDQKRHNLLVKPLSLRAELRQERKVYRALYALAADKETELPASPRKLSRLRLWAIVARRLTRKPVSIFCDRSDEADDNGLVMFRYCSQAKEETKCRNVFVIKRNTAEYRRLKSEGLSVCPYHSKRHLRLLFQASTLVSSFADEPELWPFSHDYGRYLGDKFRYNLICPKHGVDKEDMAWYEDFTKKDIRLYSVVGEREARFVRDNYNLLPDEVVDCGLPRYDRLDLNHQKTRTILLMPTWRSYLDYRAEGVSTYNPAFKDSVYFKYWNQVISSARLQELLDEYGYQMIFRPHKLVLVQKDDFQPRQGVIFDTTTPVSQLINQTDALITDYSSVFFDYAYSDKPVLYYQFDPYHHDRSNTYFDYERDAFGPLCHEPEALLEALDSLLAHGMANPEPYHRRAQVFFSHHDHDNCARLWQAMRKSFGGIQPL